jgi:tartrate dehydratase alpha subunit/fumarate hydratase class I-like protein
LALTEKDIRRRTAKGFVEATFHIPEDVMKALKMKAVQENKRFSKVAEDAFRQYLRFPKEEESTTKKKRGGTKP